MSFLFPQQCEDILFLGKCRVCASTSSDLVCFYTSRLSQHYLKNWTIPQMPAHQMNICVSTDLSLEALLTPAPAFTARALWRTCSSSEQTLLQRASHLCAAWVAWVYVISASVDICWGIKEHVARCHFISCSGACSAGQGVEEGRSTGGITAVTRQMSLNVSQHIN